MWSQSQATHLKMRRKKDILSSPAIRNQLVHGPAWNLPWCKVNGLQAPWQHPPHSRAHSLRHTIIVKYTRSLLETWLWPYFPKPSQKPSPHAGAITISTWADVLQEVKNPHKTAPLVSCVSWDVNSDSVTPELHSPPSQPVFAQVHWSWNPHLFSVTILNRVLVSCLLCYPCISTRNMGPLQPWLSKAGLTGNATSHHSEQAENIPKDNWRSTVI